MDDVLWVMGIMGEFLNYGYTTLQKKHYNKAQHLHSVYLRINRSSGVVASGQN